MHKCRLLCFNHKATFVPLIMFGTFHTKRKTFTTAFSNTKTFIDATNYLKPASNAR